VMLGKASYPALDFVKDKITGAQANLYAISPQNLPLYQEEPASNNLFVLGAVCANTRLKQILETATMQKAIQARWPKAAGRNLFAFQAGMQNIVTALSGLPISR